MFYHVGPTVAYNNTAKSVGSIQNNMQRIWHGHFLNTWAFGGDACDINATPVLTTDTFLLEIPK